MVDAEELVEAVHVAGEEEAVEEAVVGVGVVVAGDSQRSNELHDTNISILCVALCARDFLNQMIQTGSSFKSSFPTPRESLTSTHFPHFTIIPRSHVN